MEQVSHAGVWGQTHIDPSAGSPIVDHFSLFHGGPIYHFQSFIGLATPDCSRVLQRALLAILLTWLPPLILSAIQGQAFGTQVRIPFLSDYATNVRFLIALPLLILAEAVIDPRLRHAVKHFVSSGLVDGKELSSFESTIQKTNRLRDGWLPTIVLVLAAFLPSLVLRGKEIIEIIAPAASSWHTLQSEGGETLSLAGWWFALISIPIYRLFLFRWVWVIITWAVFLRRVSRLRLNCVPTHPDKAGGLGFLAHTQQFFGLIAFAGSTVVAGGIANQLAYQGATLFGLKFLIIAACVMILAIVAAPLLVLTPKLFKVQEKGLFEYGALGSGYVQSFDSKWIHAKPPAAEPLLGSADIQSLADLSNSFSVISEMRYVLLDKDTLLSLAVPTLLPMVVLILVVSPTEELIRAILKLLA